MKWAIAALVLVAGCEFHWLPDAFPVRVYVPSSVSDESLEKIVAGAEMWDAALGEKVFRVVSGNGSARAHGQIVVSHGDTSGKLAKAESTLRGCIITLGDPSHPQNDYTTIAHELGHCILGGGHDTDPTSLMHADYAVGQEIKPEHVEEVRALMR